MKKLSFGGTYGDAVSVLLSDALGLSLTLLERMLVLELAAHSYGVMRFVVANETGGP